MTAAKSSALADRLAELGGIEAGELALIVKRDPAEVSAWIDGSAEPDAAARVLLRIVFDPEREHAVNLAVERVRNTHTRDLRGDGMTYAGIDPPNGPDAGLLDGGISR
jgi:hypothetical protein